MPPSKQIHVNVADSSSPIGLECVGRHGCWDRHLTIDGEPAYHLGFACETCGFFFSRLPGAARATSNGEGISKQLGAGLQDIDDAIVESLRPVLPNGQFVATLQAATPRLVSPGQPGDYFVEDYQQLWFGREPGKPLGADYYRSRRIHVDGDKLVLEFIIPMVVNDALDPLVVADYERKISAGGAPTALAISILDIQHRGTETAERGATIKEHWCLAHYLIDGHHKTFGAELAASPINLISFLALDLSMAQPGDVAKLFSVLDGGYTP